MNRPAPLLSLLHRLRAERNDLRGQLAVALEQIDSLKADLSVAKCREKRWRGLAFKWGGGHPEAMTDMAWRAMSDDIADAPEVDERNTAPRSSPG